MKQRLGCKPGAVNTARPKAGAVEGNAFSRPDSTPIKPKWGWKLLLTHSWPEAYLKEPDKECGRTHGVHEAAIVAQQGGPAAV